MNRILLSNIVAATVIVIMPTVASAAILGTSHGDTLVGDRSSNLIQNGSFETRNAGDPAGNIAWTGVSGSSLGGRPTATTYSIPDWTVTGDAGSYGWWGPTFGAGPADGQYDLYFGNWFTTPSSSYTFNSDGTVSFASTPTFTNLGSPAIQNPVTLSQTVSGLTIGDTYLLDFYTTGEFFNDPGIFGLQISGENLLYLTTPAPNSALGSSERYQIQFTATANSQSFTWLNWGHITFNSAELILDDVILNRVDSGTTPVPEPATSILGLLAFGGLGSLLKRQSR